MSLPTIRSPSRRPPSPGRSRRRPDRHHQVSDAGASLTEKRSEPIDVGDLRLVVYAGGSHRIDPGVLETPAQLVDHSGALERTRALDDEGTAPEAAGQLAKAAPSPPSRS